MKKSLCAAGLLCVFAAWAVAQPGTVRPTAAQATTARSSVADPAGDVPAGSIRLQACLVSLIDEVKVPAQEAGKLDEMFGREGTTFEKGALLSQIDDRQPQLQKKAALAEYNSAKAKAENDVDRRFAEAAQKVAAFKHQSAINANKKAPGSFAETDIQALFFEVEKAKLQIEQADRDRKVAEFTRDAKLAEAHLADVAISRRKIAAPFDGVVVELLKHSGEWVQPGDAVMRVVRLDRLYIKGTVKADQVSPIEVEGQAAVGEIRLSRNRVERFNGKVVFVSPEVQANNVFDVWAEVENRAEAGHWLLRPGLLSAMTIELKK